MVLESLRFVKPSAFCRLGKCQPCYLKAEAEVATREIAASQRQDLRAACSLNHAHPRFETVMPTLWRHVYTCDFKSLTTCRGVSQDHGDYVIRRFNASSAGLKKSVGLDPSLSAATRDPHNQPKPPTQ